MNLILHLSIPGASYDVDPLIVAREFGRMINDARWADPALPVLVTHAAWETVTTAETILKRSYVPEQWKGREAAWWQHVAACGACSLFYEPPSEPVPVDLSRGK